MRRVALIAFVLLASASCTSTPSAHVHTRSVARTTPDSGFRMAERSADAAVASAPASAMASATATTDEMTAAKTVNAATANATGTVSLAQVTTEASDAGSETIHNAAWQATAPPPAPQPSTGLPSGDASPSPPVPPPAPAAGPSTSSPETASSEATPGGTGPAPGGAGGLTLEAAISMALAANPSIGVAHHTIQRSQGEWTQIGLYPNPIGGYVASEVGDDGKAGQQGVFVQQTFPTADKLELNRAVASGDVATARAVAAAQRLRVETDTQARFYAALGTQKLVEIARRNEEFGRQGLEATRQLEAAGESSQADVLLAVTSYQRLRVARQQAEARANAAWRQLAIMLGQPALAESPLIGELETPRRAGDFEVLWQRVSATSPELQAASARISRARARIAREQAAVVPDVDAQLSIQQDTATDDTIGGVQFGFMLPVYQKNQGGIAAAQAEYCRLVKDYERLELALRDRLVEAVRDAEVAARQVTTFGETIVPAADQGLNLVRHGYEGGEFDVLRLVTAQQTYAEAQSGYVQAQIDLQQALAVLDGVLLTGGLQQPDAPDGVGTSGSLTDVEFAR